MKLRRLVAAAAAPTLAFGIAAILPGTAGAETKTIAFSHSCRGDHGWGSPTAPTRSFDDALTITAPEHVRPGQEFTVTLQPGTMQTGGKEMSRIKYDLAVPEGADLISATVVPDSSVGLGGKAPEVLRIDESGTPNAAGRYLRISGGNETIANSPNANDGGYGGGITSAANTDFRLPAVSLVLRATAPEDGTVTTRLRTGNDPVGWKPAETSMSALVKKNSWTETNVAWYCAATGPGRDVLSSTEVYSIHATETEVRVQLESLTGDDVRITATVAPNPGEGTEVEFFDGDRSLGTATLNAEGTAEITRAFGDPGTHPITARFGGTKKFEASTSAPKTVTVVVPGVVVVEPDDPPAPDTGSLPGGTGSLKNLIPAGSSGS